MPTLVDKTCFTCGLAFQGTPRRTYCSKPCFEIGRRRKMRVASRLRPCRRCGETFEWQSPAQRYCGLHRPPPQAKHRRMPTTWKTIKKYVRLEEPNCAHCGEPSQEVDHIVPAYMGGTDDRSNLQALCRSCHRRKTARENRRRQAA